MGGDGVGWRPLSDGWHGSMKAGRTPPRGETMMAVWAGLKPHYSSSSGHTSTTLATEVIRQRVSKIVYPVSFVPLIG